MPFVLEVWSRYLGSPPFDLARLVFHVAVYTFLDVRLIFGGWIAADQISL
jgi:hypothetical protein